MNVFPYNLGRESVVQEGSAFAVTLTLAFSVTVGVPVPLTIVLIIVLVIVLVTALILALILAVTLAAITAVIAAVTRASAIFCRLALLQVRDHVVGGGSEEGGSGIVNLLTPLRRNLVLEGAQHVRCGGGVAFVRLLLRVIELLDQAIDEFRGKIVGGHAVDRRD